MSSEKSLTPQIRFKGFTEAWEQRKLGDIAAFSKGQGFSKSNLTDSGFPVILYGRLYTNYETQICKVDTFVKNSSCGVLSKGGEVIVPASGETAEDIAVASHVSLPGILLGGDLNVVTPKDNLDSNFLALFITFGNAHVELSKRAQGKSVVHVRNGDLSQLNIKYPTQSEQILISNLFIKNDNLITLHQRKLDAIKKIKSALLEKMFPKDGSDIPEIRFTGFTEAWEQRKLGDYGLVQMCRRIYKDQTSEIGDVPFFKIGTFGSQPDAFISRSLFQDYRKQYPFPSVGTPLISAAGSIGRTVIYQGEEAYFQDSNIVWLDNNEKLNNVFLNSLYKKIDWKLEGSTIKRLYNKDILNAEVCVPSTLEQCQVGSFFAHLDSLITLHQRKLDALKKIKSALLEKMFV